MPLKKTKVYSAGETVVLTGDQAYMLTVYERLNSRALKRIACHVLHGFLASKLLDSK